MADGCDEHAAGIARIKRDAGDGHGLVEAAMFPGLAAVIGVIHAAADGDAVAYVGLAGTNPHGVRMFGIDGDVADRDGFRALKDGLPGDAAVGGLEQAAGASGGVQKARIAGDAFDAGDASTHSGRADTAPFESTKKFHRSILQIGGLGGCARDQAKEKGDHSHNALPAVREILF